MLLNRTELCLVTIVHLCFGYIDYWWLLVEFSALLIWKQTVWNLVYFLCWQINYLVLEIQMDEVLASVAETIKNFAVIYLVDITEVPDFNTMYELYDPSTVMFFFRNKHIMIDLGTGNNNKINWALKDKQEFIDIVETVYRGARKGRGLVIAPKDYSTKYRY